MIDYLFLFDGFLLIVATVIAIAVIEIKDLFASVMLAGLYSLVMALVWTNMHAVDVAFTESAVGAGISTILLIGALVMCGKQEKDAPRIQPGALVIVVLTGAALIYGTGDMPAFGDAHAPIHQHRARALFEQNVGKIPGHPLFAETKDHAHVINSGHQVETDPNIFHSDGTFHDHDEHSEHADSHAHADAHTPHNSAPHSDGGHAINDDFHGHVPNTVTSLLADYRSFDTMYEVAVVLTAGLSMLILLRRRREDTLPSVEDKEEAQL